MKGVVVGIAITELLLGCCSGSGMERRRETVCIGCTVFPVLLDEGQFHVCIGEKEELIRGQYTYEAARDLVLSKRPVFTDRALKKLSHDTAMSDIDRVKSLFGNQDEDDVPGYRQWKKGMRWQAQKFGCALTCCKIVSLALFLGASTLLSGG